MWSAGCILGEMLTRRPLRQYDVFHWRPVFEGKDSLDQVKSRPQRQDLKSILIMNLVRSLRNLIEFRSSLNFDKFDPSILGRPRSRKIIAVLGCQTPEERSLFQWM